jgi:hypothetical protein
MGKVFFSLLFSVISIYAMECSRWYDVNKAFLLSTYVFSAKIIGSIDSSSVEKAVVLEKIKGSLPDTIEIRNSLSYAQNNRFVLDSSYIFYSEIDTVFGIFLVHPCSRTRIFGGDIAYPDPDDITSNQEIEILRELKIEQRRIDK